MERHSLPDDEGPHGAGAPRTPALPRTRQHRPARRRTVLAAALVLAVAAGTLAARQAGLPPFDDGCQGDSVRLRVAAAPSVAPVLRSVADRAREDRAESDGHCLDVRVGSRTGAEISSALARGRNPGFDVWVPDSTAWVDKASASGDARPVEQAGSVAASPLALAAVPSAARKMGWPDKRYSWSRIASSAAGDETVRVGSADPARSSTGLLALTRIQGSPAEKEGRGESAGGRADARTAAAAKVLAERTAPGDSQVLATLPRDDSPAETGNPRRNQALLLSEQAAYAHNTSDEDTPELRLFYPDDGLTLLDYPYAVLDSEELGTEKGRAATRFQTLLGDADGRRTFREHGFRPGNGDTVRGVARAAGARKPQPFTAAPADPPSARSLRAAQGMWTITVQSARLTIAVDASASMSAPVPGRSGQSRMDVTKAALIQGLSQFTPDDEIGLWDFATRLEDGRDYRRLVPAQRLGERNEDGVPHRDTLTGAFGDLQPIPGGATGLYDTTLAAYREAHESYTSGKFNALVLLTDGANEDPGSISRKKLLTELKEAGDGSRPVPLIAVAVGPDADTEACRKIAEATGGSSHQVDDPAQINSVIFKAVVEAGSRTG